MKTCNFSFFVLFFLFCILLVPPVNAALVHNETGSVTMDVPSGSMDAGVDNCDDCIAVTFNDPSTTTTTTTSSSGTTGTATKTTQITDEVMINELLTTLTAEDLGLAVLTTSDVTVTQIGDAVTTTTLPTPSNIDKALENAVDDEAKDALNEMKTKLESTEVKEISLTTTLEVYKVRSPITNREVYRTKVTLSFTATYESMDDVNIIEIIPKATASSTDDIVFTGEQPVILQRDPVVQWLFDKIGKGETKDLSYIVKKKVNSIDSVSLGSAGKVVGEEIPEEAPSETKELPTGAGVAEKVTFDWVAVLIVLLFLGALYYYISKEKQRKSKKKVRHTISNLPKFKIK